MGYKSLGWLLKRTIHRGQKKSHIVSPAIVIHDSNRDPFLCVVALAQ